MAEEGAGLEGLRDADSPEDEGVVEPRGQIRLRPRRGCLLQQQPRRLQRLVLGAGGHPADDQISPFSPPVADGACPEGGRLELEEGEEDEGAPSPLRFQR